MVTRAFALVFVLISVGWFGLTRMVNSHVGDVVLAHTMDKAVHFAGKIPTWVDVDSVLANGQFPEQTAGYFNDLAAANRLLDIVLYDNNGRPASVLMFSFNDYTRLAADQIDLARAQRPRDAAPPALAQGAVPNAEGEVLRVIRNGSARWETIVGVPLHNIQNERVGSLSIHLDVTRLHDAFTTGLIQKGVLMTFLGILLFGVPSIGVFLERRRVEASQRSAQYLARFDPLTDLYNRTEFLNQAQKRLRDGKLGSLAFVDVDKFKLVNDTHGHAVGDAYLVAIARLLEQSFGPTSAIGRFGGDEFVVATNAISDGNLDAKVKAALRACNREMQLQGVTISGSVSMGVAVAEHGNSFDDVLQKADTALYFAKSKGRNRAAHYRNEMGEKMRRRRAVESRLRHAVESHLFDLHFQPLVRAHDRKRVGYEALLRLNDENGAPISPAEFVPLAEEMGLIEGIGSWVLQHATSLIAAYDDESTVAINLSSEQFQSGNLTTIVRRALDAARLPAERLELEITESLLVDEASNVGFQIDELQEMGVRVAMDDFGTGFSSLNYLWRFGFDRLKIDRSFVAALEQNAERSRDVIGTIVVLGERLGMDITAEGIETEAQAELMTSLGCDVLQGFYFGKPAPLVVPKVAHRSA